MLRHLLHALRDLHVLHVLRDLQQVVCEGGGRMKPMTLLLSLLAPIRESIAEKHTCLRDVRIAEQCVKAEAHRTHRSPRWLR